jgi:serine/threonine protein kinase
MRHEPHERERFGPYFLLEQLAQGGMAQIWRARLASDVPNGDEVVVKTLLPRLVGQPIFADLFAAEARITRLLSHPGIVRLVDDGAVKRTPYLAMERVDGWDLATIDRSMPVGRTLPVDVAVAIGIDMCRAVGFAHDFCDDKGKHRPIVHGDLSPSNLMVRRDGGVTLIDFGVAHMSRRAARARAQLLIGKSGYLAPELFGDAVADARSDVFSAGVVLHELLTGRYLFVADSERETLRRLTEEPILPPSRYNPHVTRALDAAVMRALSRDPARRFESASELADALAWLHAPRPARPDRVAHVVCDLFGEKPERSVSRLAPRRARPQPRLRRAFSRRRARGPWLRVAFAFAVLLLALVAPIPKLPAVDQVVGRLAQLYDHYGRSR